MTTPLFTPAKNAFQLPNAALGEAIAREWQAHAKFNAAKMPLTSLAFTAIDKISDTAAIVEMLLIYINTDTLSYRATAEKLAAQQEEEWNPVLHWAGKTFGGIWQITTGVMPVEQPQALHASIGAYLSSLTAMELAALCVLSSGYSSLVLALAVTKKHIGAEEAFRLSRLEEEFSAEQWGRDEEADNRTARLKAEIMDADRFLGLLECV